MTPEIIIAIITSLASLVGVIITTIFSNKSHKKSTYEQTKLTMFRLEQIEKKLETHDNANHRLCRVEGIIDELKDEVRLLYKRSIENEN